MSLLLPASVPVYFFLGMLEYTLLPSFFATEYTPSYYGSTVQPLVGTFKPDNYLLFYGGLLITHIFLIYDANISIKIDISKFICHKKQSKTKQSKFEQKMKFFFIIPAGFDYFSRIGTQSSTAI